MRADTRDFATYQTTGTKLKWGKELPGPSRRHLGGYCQAGGATFHDPEQVGPVVRKQLADWRVDYFDLYIVHFPVALKYVDPDVRYPPGWFNDGKSSIATSNATIQQTCGAMEELVDKKLSRSIGISNFNIQLIMDLLRYARIRPATLQIEHHPYLTQSLLVKFAQDDGITVTAYSSLANSSFFELGMQIAMEAPRLLSQSAITSIAQKHDRTAAQVVLRWATQRGIAVIPKSNSGTRLLENLRVNDFNLDQGEIDAISAFNRGLRFNDPLNVSRKYPGEMRLMGME
ncbi:alcohol dehydrogenase [Blastomyces dermatitidis ATCC 18188]|uniref:D-xylose reductase [NAD(P)H] n=1 Tax=Ajellomyces dermatitidis (strain ATCC 18188 / CBS 674.68) TaxID=653446 RepID=F2TJ57_AJEDA|nr:alcohol dehydrogenase [Blastomyces dermatitidis ATCC 18188]